MRLIDADALIEEWKDIQGYEGLYQVSNLGRVRSVDRIVHSKNKYLQKGIELKIHSAGRYNFVGLSKNNKTKRAYIHRLVAEHFVENPNNYNVVNHKDEDKTNNRADNLEWCTSKYNANYGSRNKKMALALSKKVAMIKDGVVVREFVSQAEAKREGYSQAQISKCCNGIISHYLGYQWKFIE